MCKLFTRDRPKLTKVTLASREVPPDLTSGNTPENEFLPSQPQRLTYQPLHQLRPIPEGTPASDAFLPPGASPPGAEIGETHDGQQDLRTLIGYLTATSSEDWAVVLEVCERASATRANAKEATKALRKEFKYYDEPSRQLSAARLWAVMLRNSSELFVYQCMKSKFMDTLEDVITSQRTSPIVRERLLDVLAAAAYASAPSSKNESRFRVLWRKVKPPGKPDEGVPFDYDNDIFNPPSPRWSSTLNPNATGSY
ncbi:hypothetical protein BGW80DRAFT_1462872 [Lactifluus volemus]|nr:hypothetical protein BGW80DRAFT_1462872 [Lactifluus volemus]